MKLDFVEWNLIEDEWELVFRQTGKKAYTALVDDDDGTMSCFSLGRPLIEIKQNRIRNYND